MSAKRVIALVVVVALIPTVGFTFLIWMLFASRPAPPIENDCGVPADTGVVPLVDGALPGLDAEQAEIARIIIREGLRLGVSEHGLVTAITAAWQESKVRNVRDDNPNDYNQDSNGVFQMRPSQGWGTVEQVLDPVYASRKFFQVLKGIPGWQRLPPEVAAQRVERSGNPEAYAQWVGKATAVVNAGVSPEETPQEPAAQQPIDGRLTPAAARALAYIQANFPKPPGGIGGWAKDGHMPGSEHYSGNALDVMVLDDRKLGNRIAGYFSGKGARAFGSHNVIYLNRIWTSEGQRWKDYGHTGNATDRHMDHVHIDFLANAAPLAPPPVQEAQQTTERPVRRPAGGFNVATFNVLGASHTGNRSADARMRNAVRVLEKHDVDLVGFQEMQGRQLALFNRLTKGAWRTYHAPGDSDNTIAWNPDVFAGPLKGSRFLSVPYFDGHPRRMPAVRLRHIETGRELTHLNVHNPANTGQFPAQGKWRAAALDVEIPFLNKVTARGELAVYTGDMNDDEEFYGLVKARTKLRGGSASTYGHIDWILTSLPKPVPVRTDDSELVNRSTDHPVAVARIPLAGSTDTDESPLLSVADGGQTTDGQAVDCAETADAAMTGGVVTFPLDPGYVDNNNYGEAGSRWARRHTGNDYSVDCGTPVKAVTNGTVHIEEGSGWYGKWLVKVSLGPKALTTWYAHMQKVTVEDGQQVTAGAVIGEVGQLGNASGCHLHLEVHPKNGGIYEDGIDPRKWLAAHVGKPLGGPPAVAPAAQGGGGTKGGVPAVDAPITPFSGGAKGPAPMPYPEKAIAVYYMAFSDNKMSLAESIPAGTNVVNLAFVQGDPPRLTLMDARLIADAKRLRARGVRIVASAGGERGPTNIGNPSGFVQGIMAVNEQIPLDGLDWDVEGGDSWNTDNVVQISTQLKKLRGKNFAITMAPNGNGIDAYIPTAAELHKRGALDMIAQQFYDSAVTQDAAAKRIEQIHGAGVPYSRIGAGMMLPTNPDNKPASERWTVEQSVENMTAFRAKYPGFRGGYLWEAGRTRTADWVKAMQKVMGAGAPSAPVQTQAEPEKTKPVPEPAPKPAPPKRVIKVMPTGDSLTEAGGINGWKGELYTRLHADGLDVDYVGSQASVVGPDKQHEGHSGWQNSNFEPVISGMVKAADPDVIVYHVGTNDVWSKVPTETAVARLKSVVTKMLAADPQVRVVLAEIPYMRVPVDPEGAERAAYNEGVVGVANELARVTVADLSETLSDSDVQGDGVHWTGQGHRKVAADLAPVVERVIGETR